MREEITTAKNQENKLISDILLIFSIMSLILAFFYPWPVLAGCVALGGLALLALKPEIGLYAMIFLLPVIDWNFYFRGFEAPLIDLLGAFVFAAFFLRFFFTFIFHKERLGNYRLPVFVPFLAFFSVAVVSGLLSEYALGSLWYAVRWILFFYLVYIAMPASLISKERVLKNSIIALALSGLAVAVMGAVSLPLQDWRTGFVRVRPLSIGGVFPIGENQNLLAEYLFAGMMAVMALKFWYRSDRFGRLADILMVFFALVLLGTFSRAGWIALAVSAGAYLFYKNRFRAKDILAVLLAFLVLSPLAVYMVKLQSEYRIGVSSTENRLLLSQIAWTAFAEKPWFGQGSGEYVDLVADNIRFTAKYGKPLDSHGVWQKVLAENGALGVAAFAFFSLAIANLFRKALRDHRDKLDLLLPLILGSSSIYLFQFFNTSYYKGKLWVPVAIAMAAVYLAKENKLYGQAD